MSGDLSGLMIAQDQRSLTKIKIGKVSSISAGPPRTVAVIIDGTTYNGVLVADHVDPVVNEGVYILDMDKGRWVIVGTTNQSQTRVRYLKAAGDTMTGALLLPDGTDGAPSLSFSSDTNTGIRWVSADKLAIITNAVQQIAVDTVKVQMGLPIYLPDGSAAAPILTFTADTNTGLYRVSADVLAIVANGTAQVTIGTADLVIAQVLKTPDGTASAPAYTFTGDTDSGMYRVASNEVGIACGGTGVAKFKSGQLLVPAGSPSAPGLAFLTATTTGMTWDSSQLRFAVGGTAVAAHDGTNFFSSSGTTSATTTWRHGGFGSHMLPTSTRKLKHSIETLDGELALEVLRQTRPVRFHWNRMAGDSDDVAALREFDEQVGFIAEEMAEVRAPFGLAEFSPGGSYSSLPTTGDSKPDVEALNDWEPTYWKEPHMIALLTAAVKELSAQLQAVKQELKDLKKEI